MTPDALPIIVAALAGDVVQVRLSAQLYVIQLIRDGETRAAARILRAIGDLPPSNRPAGLDQCQPTK